MELSDIIIQILIGVGIGFGMVVIYAWYLYRDLKNRVDRMIKKVVAEAEADLVGMDIELDKDTYFCYNSKDQQFICQGKTVAEIKQAFQNRFPGKTAYLAGGDPAVVEQFKTELLKLAINEPGN
jgi:predicted small secreted protein